MPRTHLPPLFTLVVGLTLGGWAGSLFAQQENPQPDQNLQQQVQFGLACASLFRGLSNVSFEPAYSQAGFAAEQAALYQEQAAFWVQHLQDLSGETLEVANEAIASRLPQVARLVESMAQAGADERTELQQRVNQQITRCSETRELVQSQQGTQMCRGVAVTEGVQYRPGSSLSGTGASVTLVYRHGALYFSSAELRIAIPDNRMLFGPGVSLHRFAGDETRYPLHIDLQWVDERLTPQPKAYLRSPYNIGLALPVVQWDTPQPPFGRITLKRGMQTPAVMPLHFASYVQPYGGEAVARPFASDLNASSGVWELLQGPPTNLELHWGDGQQVYLRSMVPDFSLQPYLQLLEAAHAIAASGSAEACQPL